VLCHILDYTADEIRSNKARATRQLDESTREPEQRQGSKKVEGKGNVQKNKQIVTNMIFSIQQQYLPH